MMNKLSKRLIIAFLSIVMMMLLSCSQNDDEMETDTSNAAGNEQAVELVSWNKVCPVRGGEVDPEVTTVTYQGKVYGFCCPGCDDKFSEDPGKYLKNLSEDGTEFLEL